MPTRGCKVLHRLGGGGGGCGPKFAATHFLAGGSRTNVRPILLVGDESSSVAMAVVMLRRTASRRPATATTERINLMEQTGAVANICRGACSNGGFGQRGPWEKRAVWPRAKATSNQCCATSLCAGTRASRRVRCCGDFLHDLPPPCSHLW